MAFTLDSLSNSSFKVLHGKAHTSNSKTLANEAQISIPALSANSIFADIIPSDTTAATAAGVAQLVTIPLVLDASSNGKAYLATITGSVPAGLSGLINPYVGSTYASGQRMGFFIPENLGSGFRVILKDSGVEIPPLASQDWFFDYSSGVITSEDNLNLVSGTIDVYAYTGRFVDRQINKLDGYAVWQRINNDGYFVPDGYAGIGTSTPSALLHIRSNTQNNSSIRLDLDKTSWVIGDIIGSIDFSGNDASVNAGGVRTRIEAVASGTAGSTDIVFLTTPNSSTILNEVMRMSISSGNKRVGIGTSSPQAPLHILQASAAGLSPSAHATLVLENSNTNYLNFLVPDANESGILFGLASNTASGEIIYNNAGNSLGFLFRANGSVTKMSLTKDGYLGVGLSSPSAALHVNNGTTGAVLAKFQDNGSTVFSIPIGISNIQAGNTIFAADTSGSIGWAEPANGLQTFQFQDDFILDPTNTWLLNTSGTTGASVAIDNTLTSISHWGVVSAATGTSTTGWASLSTHALLFVVGNDLISFEALINIPTLSAVGQEYTLRVGFGDSPTNAEPGTGAYFEYIRTTSVNWRVVNANGASYTRFSTSTAVATGWTSLRMEIPDASGVRFYVNNVLVHTNTTNLPLTTAIAPFVQMVKTTGGTSRDVKVDYINVFKYFSVANRLS